MPEILSVQLFGTLQLRLGNRTLPPLGSARVESVLAYLLLNREAPQTREQLAFRLWPDSSEAQARTNLRHVLHNLRRALPSPDAFIDVRSRTVQWKADAPATVDVDDFDSSLARAEQEGDATRVSDTVVVSLRNAVSRYRGDLLEGCYDEWITPHRDHLSRRFLVALERLATVLTERGEYTEAVQHGERLMRLEPLREDAYRLLMRLHDARGDRALALQVYQACVETLAREVGAQPSVATREAHEALLRGASQTKARRATAVFDPATAGPPPLVGRADEWARLTTCWRAAEAGAPSLLLVTGEAGVGKTRLVEELCAWCDRRGAIVAEARSYAAEGALAYAPLAAWLRAPTIAGRVKRMDRHTLSELSRLLPELASGVPGVQSPQSLPEDEHRRRLFEAAAHAFHSLGSRLLLVADDIQWCDHETLRFLHFLLRRASTTPLLVAATARSEETERRRDLLDLLTGARSLGSLAEIELQRLSRDSTLDLASRLTGRALDSRDADALYRETEGNALFVVEAIRAGWRGETPAGDALPPRVHAVIASRLDQLSAATRNIIGVAATLARDFTIDLLAEAADQAPDEVARRLDELWRARIIREHAGGVYDFSHDKIREVAYRTLSPPQRRQYHLRAAQALKRSHGRATETVSGVIADHYDRAGAAQEASRWYETAAEASEQLYASRETIRLLTRALDLVASFPPTPERRARELAVHTAMLAPVMSAYGAGSERLDALHARIVELAHGLGVDLPPQAMRTLAIAGLTRDDFANARRYGEQLRGRGRMDGDDSLMVEGEYVLGIAAFWSGNLVAARTHFEEAAARYRGDRRRTHLLRYGLDPQVVCLSRLANTLWFLGDESGAADARDRAIKLAEEVGHEYSRRTALVFAALLALDMGDATQFRAYVAALEGGLIDQNTRPTRFAAEVYRAYLQVVDGEPQLGLSKIRAALAELGGSGHAPGQRATTGRLLVAACEAVRDERARLSAADQLLSMGGAAALYEAYAHLVRADCLAELRASPAEVVAALERALEVARRQGARVFEARAVAALERYRPAVLEHVASAAPA
jgi:DNA-binding SARP family transcriptional activator